MASGDGAEHTVDTSEVAFPESSVGARLVAAYRKWLGLEPTVAPNAVGAASRKRHKAADEAFIGRRGFLDEQIRGAESLVMLLGLRSGRQPVADADAVGAASREDQREGNPAKG